ncbi:MAG: ribonuclease HII [bacterium]|nr:ribonuclease HII [bacterium]
MKSLLKEERKLWKRGYKRVACLDEAGRGPLAGPVIACVVTVRQFPISNFQFPNIRDSKKLSAKKREEFYNILTKHPDIEWGIGRVSEKVIDKINILESTKLAMSRALIKLKKKPSFLILDGNFKINSAIPQKSIIKADEKVFSCMAAGIIAKVTRDRIMKRYHLKYPCYGFDKHKGYPTKKHKRVIKKNGICKIHRKTFRPIKKV